MWKLATNTSVKMGCVLEMTTCLQGRSSKLGEDKSTCWNVSWTHNFFQCCNVHQLVLSQKNDRQYSVSMHLMLSMNSHCKLPVSEQTQFVERPHWKSIGPGFDRLTRTNFLWTIKSFDFWETRIAFVASSCSERTFVNFGFCKKGDFYISALQFDTNQAPELTFWVMQARETVNTMCWHCYTRIYFLFSRTETVSLYCVLPCTYFPFRAVTRCSSPDSQECAVLQYSMHRAWSNAPRLFLFYICRYSNYYCPRLMNSFHQIDSLANFARCSSSETLSSYRSTVFFSFLHSLGPPVKSRHPHHLMLT